MPIKQSAIFIGKLCVCFKQAVLKLDIVDFLGCGFDLNHGSIVKSSFAGGATIDEAAQNACRLSMPQFVQTHQGRRGVNLLEDLAVAEVHVHPAWKTGIEAPHSSLDINAFEVFRIVFLEDGVFCTASS